MIDDDGLINWLQQWRLGMTNDAEFIEGTEHIEKENISGYYQMADAVMTNIEKRRNQIRNALEAAIKNAIFDEKLGASEEQILDDWLQEEDGNIALDRLITLIMH